MLIFKKFWHNFIANSSQLCCPRTDLRWSYHEATANLLKGHWANFCWFICHLFAIFCHWRHVHVICKQIPMFIARRSVS